ncbi:HK97 family phage prohead protease [Clostridium perfringens]|uniref:HK97 family phage prohead protease n=1 Tax=Clostridium perfringens TaxID=1502 RepID=UPI001CCCAF8B|nr:HK97 family phage prohead protease [Clostridium perfringens]EGT0692904.1 HK97 family phage prohead protease [Clostridium perfringens]EIF6167632.1 HK97 family phage prohead protease [Clostridium perfringens]ELC8395791.1 HK97 family phage prohead protease [Clostridium perfringens]MDH5068712.1 Caudovirus prohead protease [Clostridium perfringens]MDH5088863.1 Caudovirus prohead protease [Clostridium perfringens]
MQNLEIREQDGVYKIGGYINATERNSNILKDKEGRKFIEKVRVGAFKEALEDAEKENREIPLMYRHKKLITKNVELREDNIGLRFEAEVDEDTYNMVKDNNLQCSFGFVPLKENIKNITLGFYERLLEKIKLLEVTITPLPAYNGSLVECREGEDEMELRELLELREELDKKIEELTDKELEEEKKDEKEDEVEKPIERKIAEIDVQIAEEEVNEKEHEIAQKRLILEKAKMQLELIKLKAE